MTILHAQPYDISANGFYFETEEQYSDKITKARNSYGWPVEEFEIQFIDGDNLDARLFSALGIHQGNFAPFFEVIQNWDEHEKIKVIIAVSEVGYDFNLEADTPENFDIDLYEMDSLRDLAIQFVDEGLFGDIPANIQAYLDYDAIARDLGMDYSEITIEGNRYIYRCE